MLLCRHFELALTFNLCCYGDRPSYENDERHTFRHVLLVRCRSDHAENIGESYSNLYVVSSESLCNFRKNWKIKSRSCINSVKAVYRCVSYATRLLGAKFERAIVRGVWVWIRCCFQQIACGKWLSFVKSVIYYFGKTMITIAQFSSPPIT